MRFVIVLAVAIATLRLAVAPALAASPGGHGNRTSPAKSSRQGLRASIRVGSQRPSWSTQEADRVQPTQAVATRSRSTTWLASRSRSIRSMTVQRSRAGRAPVPPVMLAR